MELNSSQQRVIALLRQGKNYLEIANLTGNYPFNVAAMVRASIRHLEGSTGVFQEELHALQVKAKLIEKQRKEATWEDFLNEHPDLKAKLSKNKY